MTKAEYVAERLRQGIEAGQWKTGERLPSESELCRLFGVSRLSVRSAVGMLAAQGLAETYRGKGSFVREKPADRTPPCFDGGIGRMDIFEFRRILEGESAALAAQRADAETIRTLRDATIRMESAQTRAEIAAWDEEFHRLIAFATQNELVIRIFSLLKDAFRRMFEQNVSVLGAEGCKDHRRIIAAIEGRNPELSKQYMCEHLYSTMEKTSMLNSETPAADAPSAGQ